MSILTRLARSVVSALRPRAATSVREKLDLAAAADGRGDHAAAERLCREALALAPADAEGWMSLGLALQPQGRIAEACAAFERSIEIEPSSAAARYNLGRLHHAHGRYDAAVTSLARAVEIAPTFVDALILLADARAERGERQQALDDLSRALDLVPAHPGALHNRAQLLYGEGAIDETVDMYRAALEADPRSADAAVGLALALTEVGGVEEALELARNTLDAHPESDRARIVYLFNLLLSDAVAPERITAEHRRIAALYEAGVSPRRHVAPRDPEKRLKVGYVSGDFRAHSSSLFMEHVLELRDRAGFTAIAYSCANVADAWTERLRPKFDVWRDVIALDDETLARVIESDGIDVLVDLSGYTSASRMGVFARRPAPVQVTWFAYVSTTGLAAMTHRLTDGVVDPPGSDRYSTEVLQRLPHSVWCYRPPPEALIDVAGGEAAAGPVRFGAFNRYAKVSPTTLTLWCDILRACPGATLTMLTVPKGSAQGALLARFEAAGIDAARITLAPRLSQREYYAAYRDVDVCLDTTPYSGATTTCDALWMGVPLVTLSGATSVSRSAASILTHAGFGEWVAQDAGEYVRRALELARRGRTPPAARAAQRAKFRASPLMDEAGYTRDVEQAFRSMWTGHVA